MLLPARCNFCAQLVNIINQEAIIYVNFNRSPMSFSKANEL
jgi:hypothetical protein